MDTLTPSRRSWNMAQIHSRDTKPEIAFRHAVFARGYRYRICDKRLPGKPDIVFPKYHAVVFINGCFWHHHKGCKRATTPKSNMEFWLNKFRNNQLRDKKVHTLLKKSGWRVLVLWECELEDLDSCVSQFERFIHRK